MEREIGDANKLIKTHAGVLPSGFRAPGYIVNDEVMRALSALGMRYDSSVFPCPSYYAAKWLALGAHRLFKRRSASIVDSPRVLGAPTQPYRVGQPYTQRGNGVLELPIGVTKGLRLPYIGTSLILGGERLAHRLTTSMLGAEFINLELHGIDLLGADDLTSSRAETLRRSQPDLRISSEKKRRILLGVIEQLRAFGYTFLRLDEAASRF